MMGFDHQQVAAIFMKTRRTIDEWIRRFNKAGIDGLIDKPCAGRPRVITPEQSQCYKQIIEKPDLADETHWTARKFHGYPKRPKNTTAKPKQMADRQ